MEDDREPPKSEERPELPQPVPETMPVGQASGEERTDRDETAEIPDTAGWPPAGLAPTSAVTEFPKIDGYQIEEKIAHGGMGVVYRARQLRLNRTVALKVIKAGSLADDEQIARFYTEAEAAGRLDHPAIVPIYEVGESNGQHFYSMAFVEGCSLADLLRDRLLESREAAAMLLVLAEAIEYAHSKNVIHRDLKPANVLLAHSTGGSTSSHGRVALSGSLRSRTDASSQTDVPSWYPKITDFGLAKQIESDSELTSTGQVLGTPGYMPPEQVEATQTVGPPADIYALGSVLYAMLTGRPPFQAASVMETLRQVVERDPVPPTRFNPAIDRDLETICLKCLEKRPVNRYASAGALADDLRAYLSGEPISARPVSAWERAWRWCRRKPAAALAIATLAGLLLSLVAVGMITARLRYVEKAREAQEARLQAAKRERQLREAELASARKLADERAKLAEAQRYFSLVADARAGLVEPKQGWAYEGIHKLREAANVRVSEVVDRPALRALSAQLLRGVDARLIREIKMPLGYRSRFICFHPAGHQMAIATEKNRFLLRILLCNPVTGEVTRKLGVRASARWQLKTSNMDGIYGLAYVLYGKGLAAMSRSGWVYVWDLTSDPPRRRDYRFGPDGAGIVAFHPSRPELYYAEGNQLWRWRWETDEGRQEIGTGTFSGRIVWLAIDARGKRLAASDRQMAAAFDAETGELIGRRYEGFVGPVALSPDGRLLAVAGGPTGGTIFDLDTQHQAVSLQPPGRNMLHTEPCLSLAWSGDGRWLVSASHDRRIHIWDVATGELALDLPMPGRDEPFAVTDSAGHYLSATGNDGVWHYELLPDQARSIVGPFAGQVMDFDTGASGKLAVLVVRSDPQQSRILSINTATGGVDAEFRTDAHALRAAVSNRACTVAWLDKRAGLRWCMLPDDYPNLPEKQRQALFSDPKTWQQWELTDPRAVDISDDGKKALVAWRSTRLLLGDLEKGQPLAEWNNDLRASIAGTASFLAVDQRGLLTVVSSTDSTARLMEGTTLRWESPTPHVVTAVAIAPDRKTILWGLDQGEIVVASLEGKPIHRWRAHGEAVRSLDFSEDGTLLAVGSADRTVSIWRQHERQYRLVVRLPRESTIVQRVRWLGSRLWVLPANQPYVVTWNWKRLMRLWQDWSIAE